MCRDRHPEIFWKSGQIWQKLGSGRGEIWEFGFSQEPGGAGIHPGGFVLRSGPQKLNYCLIWAIWGSVRANFPILFYYLGVPPGSPIGSSLLRLLLFVMQIFACLSSSYCMLHGRASQQEEPGPCPGLGPPPCLLDQLMPIGANRSQ